MLKLDNLAVSKELDRAEMGAIVGGASIFQNNGINANSIGGFSFASPQTNVAPVTQVDASKHTDVDREQRHEVARRGRQPARRREGL